MKYLQILLFFIFITHQLRADDVTGVVTHASTSTCPDGTIDLTVSNGYPPYTFTWSGPSGLFATTEDVAGLVPGTYTVAVEDAFCGRAVVEFTVKSQGRVFVADKKNLFECYQGGQYPEKGLIDLESVDNGVYTYLWSTGATTQDLGDIGEPGTYTVTVTNANGCTQVLSADICCCNIEKGGALPNWSPPANWQCDKSPIALPLNITGTVIPPHDETKTNGEIKLTISGGKPQKFYRWTGPNGFKANTKDISGLIPGNYCVTVKDGCEEKSKCFVVPLCDNVIVTGAVENTCLGLEKGKILVAVTGGTAPYTFLWNNGTKTSSLVNIKAASYCVTVKDKNGCSGTACFQVGQNPVTKTGCSYFCNGAPVTNKVGEFLIATQTIPGCAGNGSIDAMPLFGTAPYTYQWSNGKTGQSSLGFASGSYALTVRDAEGCSLTKDVTIKNKEHEEPIKLSPCVGAGNGSIWVTIANPKSDPVEVKLAGASVPLPTVTAPSFKVNIPSLQAGDYPLEVKIGSCQYNTTVKLRNKDSDLIYNGQHQGDQCFYDEYCNGELIQQGGISSTWFVSREYGSAAWLGKCEAKAFCGNDEVGTVGYNKRSATAFEYETILLSLLTAGSSPFTNGYILSKLDVMRGYKLEPCDHLRYCEANMEILSRRTALQGGSGTCDNTGCCTVDCLLKNHQFCVSNSLPPGVIANSFDECRARSYNVLQLILWMDGITARYPAFNPTGGTPSELYTFLQEHKDHPSVACADVIFCLKTFAVLHSDIDQIVCPEPDPDPDPNPTQNPEPDPCEPELIQDSGNDTQIMAAVCPNGGWPVISVFDVNFTGLGDNLGGKPARDTIYTIMDNRTPKRFEHFGFTFGDEGVQPKGLFRDGEDNIVFLDYMPNMVLLETVKGPDVGHFVDNWDNGMMVYSERLSDNAFRIHFDNNEMENSKTLKSTGFLKIDDIFEKNKTTTLFGSFTGDLIYSGTVVASASSPSVFSIRMDSTGQFGQVKVFGNISLNSDLDVRESGSGYVLTGQSKSNSVQINDTNYPLSNQGGFFEARLSDNGQVLFAPQPLAVDMAMSPLKTVGASGKGKVSIFQGTSTATVGGSNLPNQPQILLVAMDSLNILKWNKALLLSAEIANDEMDVAMSKDGNIYMALTFKDSVTVGTVRYRSKGKKDILLMEFDTTGQVVSAQQFGTNENEVVKECLYDNISRRLYFGGEYDGATTKRKIGKNLYTNVGLGQTGLYNAFITYVQYNDLSPQNRPSLDEEPDRSTLSSQKVGALHVYPNPAKTEFYVSLETPMSSIQVFNAQGTLVWETAIKSLEKVQKIAPINQWSTGIYWVKVQDNEGRIWSKKIAKY